MARPTRHQPGFQIDFSVLTEPAEAQRSNFSAAAQRWSEVIDGDVRDVVIPGVGRVDDIYIDVIVAELDGTGGTLCPSRFQTNDGSWTKVEAENEARFLILTLLKPPQQVEIHTSD